jgi:acid phosphatase
MSLFAALLPLAGCVSISQPPEGTTVPSPVRVKAVVVTPTQNSDGSWTVKPGDKQVRAEVRVDGVLKETFNAPGGSADSISIDRSYALANGAHTLTITGFEVDGDTSQDTRHFTVGAPAIRNVVWIFFENHGYNQVRNVGEFKALADSYGEATNFFAHTHPSQPNYIFATAGQGCGITTNDLSTCSAENLFHQVGDSQWRSYQESMAGNCDRTTTGPSPVKHDPARTYTNINCAANDQPLPANPSFDRRFTFVTPNMCNSAHDCSLQSASDFLASFTPKVLDSPQYKAGQLLYVVTFDEDEGSEGNHVYTALVHERARGKKVSTRYDFCNLLATTEDLLGAGRAGCAVGAASMKSSFGL